MMSEPGDTIEAYINPLAFTEVEEPWASASQQVVTDSDLRRYLCEPGLDSTVESIVGRYKEISIEGNDRIFVSPLGILAKMVWPLRHAKASYSLGNYLGAIALCGMVAEMAAVLYFEAVAEHLGVRSGKATPVDRFKANFEPGAFERLSQAQRIDVLAKMGLVTAEVKEWFHGVRAARRRHLHLMSHEIDTASSDAVKAFVAAVKIVKFALGLDVKEGKVILRPEMFSWMKANK
jgi:hypothetical protein